MNKNSHSYTRTFDDAIRILSPIANAYGTNARWLAVRTADYFGTLDFSGQRVLEIGAGQGLYACCVAALGAEQVVALEPQMDGGKEDAIQRFEERLQLLKLTNVEFHPISMQVYQVSVSSAPSFDLIYMLAVINHISEDHVRTLHSSEESRTVYRLSLQPIFEWLRPDGQFIVSDVSRTNFFTPLIRLGILRKHPFQKSINWDIHQPPSVWLALLEDVGFVNLHSHWATNWRYPWIPRFLLDNPLAAQLYSSLFVLNARHP